MTPAYEALVAELKRLPGLGFRSAERLAMHLLVENVESAERLLSSLVEAREQVKGCGLCGNLTEASICEICADDTRSDVSVCVVEQIMDLLSIERSGAWKGRYHVLHGKLSPIHGVGPDELNMRALSKRVESGEVEELVLALSNDVEGRATCHFIQEEIVQSRDIKISRIGFGLPSGGGVTYADAVTLKSAIDGRRDYQ